MRKMGREHTYVILTLGDYRNYSEVTYVFGKIKRKGKLSLTPLIFNEDGYVDPSTRVVILLPDTVFKDFKRMSRALKENGGSYEKYCRAVKEQLLDWIKENEERVYDLICWNCMLHTLRTGNRIDLEDWIITVPGPELKKSSLLSTYKGEGEVESRTELERSRVTLCASVAAPLILDLIIKDIGPEETPGEIKIKLDNSHGLNYITELILMVMKRICSILASLYNCKVTLEIYNSDPVSRDSIEKEYSQNLIQIDTWDGKTGVQDLMEVTEKDLLDISGEERRETRELENTYSEESLKGIGEKMLYLFISARYGLILPLLYCWRSLLESLVKDLEEELKAKSMKLNPRKCFFELLDKKLCQNLQQNLDKTRVKVLEGKKIEIHREEVDFIDYKKLLCVLSILSLWTVVGEEMKALGMLPLESRIIDVTSGINEKNSFFLCEDLINLSKALCSRVFSGSTAVLVEETVRKDLSGIRVNNRFREIDHITPLTDDELLKKINVRPMARNFLAHSSIIYRFSWRMKGNKSNRSVDNNKGDSKSKNGSGSSKDSPSVVTKTVRGAKLYVGYIPWHKSSKRKLWEIIMEEISNQIFSSKQEPEGASRIIASICSVLRLLAE